ncbi:hypothetical protein IG631_20895 [Alternaria alternata]|nr:hypothetical protein IG631_20895 [Alternaria alternata]
MAKPHQDNYMILVTLPSWFLPTRSPRLVVAKRLPPQWASQTLSEPNLLNQVIPLYQTKPCTVFDAKSRFAQAKIGGDVSSGGFAARAQGAGGRNANAGSQQGTGEKK